VGWALVTLTDPRRRRGGSLAPDTDIPVVASTARLPSAHVTMGSLWSGWGALRELRPAPLARDTRAVTTFKEVLPRLAATYETGRLVPFLGSGMSVPVCTDWWTFVHRLESAAAGHEVPAYPPNIKREDLIRRANSAVRSLKAGKIGTFEPAVRKALLSDGPLPPIPEQMLALAKVRWPLVLTTNYDNCYPAALRRQSPDRQIAIVGRSPEDCQRVLNSLSVAGRSLQWALQGYLNAPYELPGMDEAMPLRQQLVVGHEEYRRVTYRDLHFRRAFAEVFRQRSLLFLGAGIQEAYLQELFGEVLEYYGPSTRPHYAFIQKGEVDPDFMLARFQIVAIEYDKGDHHTVTEQLDRLADVITNSPRAQVSWSWGRTVRQDDGHWNSVPDLEVVRGPLPPKGEDGDCLAISAGGRAGAFFFSEGIQQLKEQWGVARCDQPEQRSEYLGEYPGKHVFAIRARTESDERELSHIHDASLDFFQRVAPRYQRIRMQLLATGGVDKLDSTSSAWRVRNYPERFSFIQTVRAWGEWRRAHPDANCQLAIHVVLDAVYLDIASGRIDVLELLSCSDLRFFVEVIADGGEIERRLLQMLPQTAIDDLIAQLQLSPDCWTLEVTPPPSLEPQPPNPLRSRSGETLQSLGVVPGSTIHFRRVGQSRARRAIAAVLRW
jgi:hypothetical protein